MKLNLDRKTKLVLLHWLKDGCIDTEELKTIEDGHLLGGSGAEYDFVDFTDDELKEFCRMVTKATKKAKQRNERYNNDTD